MQFVYKLSEGCMIKSYLSLMLSLFLSLSTRALLPTSVPCLLHLCNVCCCWCCCCCLSMHTHDRLVNSVPSTIQHTRACSSSLKRFLRCVCSLYTHTSHTHRERLIHALAFPPSLHQETFAILVGRETNNTTTQHTHSSPQLLFPSVSDLNN